jgi:hypothetical protein
MQVRGAALILGRLVGAVLLAVAPGACATTKFDSNIALTNQPVTALVVGEASDVPALVLASAMMRAGFTDEQILREGPGVRTALATSGGAQVRDEQSILALFSVQNGLLYISSRERGTFTMRIDGT